VGQTWLPLHIRMGKEGSNYKNSLYLYSALQKHGADKFQYQILVQCRDQESADYYDSRDPQIGYNIKEGGSAGRHSDETRKKISETLKAQAAAWSPEELSKRSAPIAGWWAGKERGPMDANHKSIVIKTLKPGQFEGHHHTEEAKAAMSLKNKGRKLDPDMVKQRSLKRMMDSKREQDIVQAYQNGISISKMKEDFQTSTSSIYRILKRNDIRLDSNRNDFSGKEHSEETRQKMADARKRYWDDKKLEKSGTSDLKR
jgi:hypothetical protein